MPPITKQDQTKTHWRSLAELADAPEFRAFLEAEFPKKADPEGISRRRWLQLMGASLALAGTAGCRWEKEEILPFAERPEGRVPGVAERYATAMDLSGNATGLLVTVYDGRPIKIEGNPKHPQSLGPPTRWPRPPFSISTIRIAAGRSFAGNRQAGATSRIGSNSTPLPRSISRSLPRPRARGSRFSPRRTDRRHWRGCGSNSWPPTPTRRGTNTNLSRGITSGRELRWLLDALCVRSFTSIRPR